VLKQTECLLQPNPSKLKIDYILRYKGG
jgi:hypothetical protein